MEWPWKVRLNIFELIIYSRLLQIEVVAKARGFVKWVMLDGFGNAPNPMPPAGLC